MTDEELLAQTGGVVQGMSGSAILQDGKIIGAVTHVLLDDPSRGYGIFIENMLSGPFHTSFRRPSRPASAAKCDVFVLPWL